MNFLKFHALKLLKGILVMQSALWGPIRQQLHNKPSASATKQVTVCFYKYLLLMSKSQKAQ